MDFARPRRGAHNPTSTHQDGGRPFGVIHLDLNGCVVNADPAFLTYAHLTSEQARGFSLSDYLDLPSRLNLSESIDQIKTGKINATRLLLRSTDGHAFTADLILEGSVHHPTGVALLIQPSQNEMILPKRLADTLRIANLTDLEQTEDVIYICDAGGVIQYVNPAIQKYKMSPAELIGRHFLEFIAQEDQDDVTGSLERIIHGKVEVMEFSVANSHGDCFHVRSYNQTILEDDQVVGLRGLLLDEVISADFRHMLERRAAQLFVLNRIGEELFLEKDLEQILAHAVQLIQSSFGYFHVAIYLPHAEHGNPVMTARSGSISSQFPPDHSLELGQGLVGWVFEHRETALANNVSIDPRYVNIYPERIPTRSELVVPIQTGEQFFGVLDAQSPLEKAFDQNDISLFETVSRQLALGIENANLYHQVSLRLQQQERAESLMRLQRDLLAGLSAMDNFQAVLQQVINTLTRIDGIDGGSIYLVDETGGLDMVAYKGLTSAFAAAVSYLPPEAHKTQFVRQGRIDYMSYASLPFDPRIPADVRSAENILCIAVLPIKFQSEVIADLTLCSHTLPMIPMDARVVMESVAAALGATIARIKTENVLTANQAQKTALFEAIPDLILVVDSSGRLHNVKPSKDPSAYLLPDEILGKRLHQFLPVEDADYVLDRIREALVTGHNQLFTYDLFSEEKHCDEYFEARVSPVDEELAIVIIRNITESRLTELDNENRDRKYSALFELNKDAVLLFDPLGQYMDANQQACHLLGYSHDEFKGLSYLDLVAPEEREQAEVRLAAMRSGEKLPLYERTFLHKNGARVQCEVNSAVVLDAGDRPIHIQSILRDIGQYKQAVARLEYACHLEKTYSHILTHLIDHDKLESFFPDALKEAGSILNAARTAIFIGDFNDRKSIRSVDWQAPGAATQENPAKPKKIDIKPVWKALSARNTATSQEAFRDPFEVDGMLAVPIYAANHPYGILLIEGKPDRQAWLEEEIGFLRNLAMAIGRRQESIYLLDTGNEF